MIRYFKQHIARIIMKAKPASLERNFLSLNNDYILVPPLRE